MKDGRLEGTLIEVVSIGVVLGDGEKEERHSVRQVIFSEAVEDTAYPVTKKIEDN
jgi:hypothetical protein